MRGSTVLWFAILFSVSLSAQTLPLKWEANLEPWAGDIDIYYFGKIDASNTGKILVEYRNFNGKFGYAVYNGGTHTVQYIDTALTTTLELDLQPSPFGVRRIAPPLQPDFNNNGIIDMYVPSYSFGGPGQLAFLDPSTASYTLLMSYNQTFAIIDADDIDNDGIYELIVAEGETGNRRLRVYNTGTHVATSVQGPGTLPASISMSQNYPNPFNPTTKIRYELSAASSVGLQISDIMGRTVRSISYPSENAGAHEIPWDGKDNNGKSVSSGTYFYRLTINGMSLAKKMLLLR